jgi:hypothetical protein
MKTFTLKLLMLFFISSILFSCNDESPLTEIETTKAENSDAAAASSAGRIDPQAQAMLASSSIYSYFNTYRIGGGLEVSDAFVDHGRIVTGIGASVNKDRNVDRIVIATRVANVENGTLGPIEYFGFGAVGSTNNKITDCEVWAEVPASGIFVVTGVGVASQGADMAHISITYRDYDPITRRLGNTPYTKKVDRQSGVSTQRSFTVPSYEPINRTVVTGINLGCAGSTGKIDGFEVQYGVLQ